MTDDATRSPRPMHPGWEPVVDGNSHLCSRRIVGRWLLAAWWTAGYTFTAADGTDTLVGPSWVGAVDDDEALDGGAATELEAQEAAEKGLRELLLDERHRIERALAELDGLYA